MRDDVLISVRGLQTHFFADEGTDDLGFAQFLEPVLIGFDQPRAVVEVRCDHFDAFHLL